LTDIDVLCNISIVIDMVEATSQPNQGEEPTMAHTNTFHVSLYVDDIEKAVDRYRKLLNIEPAKVRPGYAKFEIEDPPVILALNLGGPAGELSHLGIRYPSGGEVATELARTRREGIDLLEQKDVTCCYARADKFWVRDADGVPWEMYTLKADVEMETAADPETREFLGQGTAAAASGRP
jgi:catechol 2,3-dioxygenase-like lactoylglutathione lyase family enzyme